MREILARHSLHLKRDLGQNFLVNEQLAERLVQLAGVKTGDSVIEVGTGLGCLTRPLAARAERVASVEIDSGVVRALREEGLLPANVELIHADALKVDLSASCEELGPRVRLVANLPYSVATPLLRKLLDLRDRLLDWSVMLQSEVAERIVAGCGSKAYGSLSVLHQLCVDARIECELAPASFFPAPRVSSSFVRLQPRRDSPLAEGELAPLERVARAAFGKRRKTITNSIRSAGFPVSLTAETLRGALEQAGIAPTERAERVPPEQFLVLSRMLAPYTGAAPANG
jgi:16S rRNA (adenine1518-N6/adenine1519-N6)-dimethyltransferase